MDDDIEIGEKESKEQRYVLLKDVTIPAGTVFTRAPSRIVMDADHFSASMGLSANTYGDFIYCIDRDFIGEIKEYFTELKD